MLKKKTALQLPSSNLNGWPWEIPQKPANYETAIKWPRITVLVPSFNQGNFIEETLRSIILQQYPDLELIVIDGGSTDQTTLILEKYSPWITHWVSEKDKGQSDALNKGIQWASGTFIGWQNSDDIYYPDALKTLALKALKGYDVVYSSIIGINEVSNEITRLYFTPFHPMLLQYYTIVFSNQAALYSATLMKQLGIREHLHFAMDFDLEFRLWKAGAKFGFVKGILGAIRFHADAKTVKEFNQKVQQEVAAVRYEYGIVARPDLPIFKQYPIMYMCCLFYVAFWKSIYGGLGFRIKKMFMKKENLFAP